MFKHIYFFLVAIRLQIGMEAQTRERVWMPGEERYLVMKGVWLQ